MATNEIVKSNQQAIEIARNYAYRNGVNESRAEAFAEVWFDAGKDFDKSAPSDLRALLDLKFNRMTKTIEQAEAALDSANAAWLDELRQDCERVEGSGAQERRREEHQQSLRATISQCERDLAEAKRLAQ